MIPTLAVLSLVLGAVYASYGLMTAVDMRAGWRTRGFSHFGAAWIAMAFTCGPHHFEHGVHLAFAGRSAGGVELAAVAVGFPAGVIWFLLRMEALFGGRGDRFVSGTPGWLRTFGASSAVYGVLCAVVAGALLIGGGSFLPTMTPNILLLVLYAIIGMYLLRTQLRNRAPMGGWSVSGVSLTCVFFTCGIMHAFWLVYAARGVYDVDMHGLVIDWLSVPAATYFLWVVRSLYLGAAADWNRDAPSIDAPERAVAAA